MRNNKRYTVYVIEPETTDMLGDHYSFDTLDEAKDKAFNILQNEMDVTDKIVVCIDDNKYEMSYEWQKYAYGYMSEYELKSIGAQINGYTQIDGDKTMNESVQSGNRIFNNTPSSNNNIRPINVSKDRILEILKTDEVQDYFERNGFKLFVRYDKIFVLSYYIADYENHRNEYIKIANENKTKIQKMINFLDTHTDLYFEMNSEKTLYSYAGYYSTYKQIMNIYDLEHNGDAFRYLASLRCHYDINNVFFCDYCWNDFRWKLKSSDNSTELKLDDVKNDIVDYCNMYLRQTYRMNDYTVSLQVGKRQSETNKQPYEAFVLESPESNKHGYGYGYLGSFVIKQNRFGDCKLKVRSGLGVTYDTELDLENYEDKIKKALNFMLH